VRTFKIASPALLLAALVLVPFLGKAFTMDDTVFLLEARHALADPLHPTAFEMTWDHATERVSSIVPTGPVMAWLLVPSVMAGGDERLAHAVQLLLLGAAVLATVSLALRLGLGEAGAGTSGLLLAATPAVLGMAGTAMPDVPAMALGVAGIERLVAWRDERKAGQAAAAALLLGFAILARMHFASLLGIAVLLAVRNPFDRAAWRKALPEALAPIACAGLFAAAMTALTLDRGPGGGNVLATALRYSSIERLSSNIAAFAIHWALAMAFAVPWIAARWRELARRWPAALGAAAAAALLLHLAHGDAAPYRLVPAAGLGAALLLDVLVDGYRRRDGTQFTLGLWLLMPLAAAAYVHLPAKFLLLSAPAASILAARALGARPRTGRIALAAALVLGAGLGVAILRADAAFSGLGREAAAALIRPAVEAGRRVWFVGHWGFQWYAEAAGGRYLTSTRPYPAPGDLIVSSRNCAPGLDVGRIAAFVLLRRLEDRTPGGRVMSREDGAGFYANAWGYLPWAWGDGAIDVFDVREVSPQ
jgi:4-amino-4-deoxy-L-arabinose transferase-like glycosyltransferase